MNVDCTTRETGFFELEESSFQCSVSTSKTLTQNLSFWRVHGHEHYKLSLNQLLLQCESEYRVIKVDCRSHRTGDIGSFDRVVGQVPLTFNFSSFQKWIRIFYSLSRNTGVTVSTVTHRHKRKKKTYLTLACDNELLCRLVLATIQAHSYPLLQLICLFT